MKKLFLLLTTCGMIGINDANILAKTIKVFNYTNCSCTLSSKNQSVTCGNNGIPENIYGYYQISDNGEPDFSQLPVTITPSISRADGAELFTAAPLYENNLHEYSYWLSIFNPLKIGDSGVSPSADSPVHPDDSLIAVQLHSDNMSNVTIGVVPKNIFNVKTCQTIPDLGTRKIIG